MSELERKSISADPWDGWLRDWVSRNAPRSRSGISVSILFKEVLGVPSPASADEMRVRILLGRLAQFGGFRVFFDDPARGVFRLWDRYEAPQ